MATTTTPTTHVPVVRCETGRDKALADLFTTALEGGIGYWSRCSRYVWSVDGTLDGQAKDFIAVIEDEDEVEYVIDRAAVSRGLRLAYEYYKGSTGQPYIAKALADLNFGKYDDADYDATVADVVVQFGVLGELVYG